MHPAQPDLCCPKCGAPVSGDAWFCPECGLPALAPVQRAPLLVRAVVAAFFLLLALPFVALVAVLAVFGGCIPVLRPDSAAPPVSVLGVIQTIATATGVLAFHCVVYAVALVWNGGRRRG